MSLDIWKTQIYNAQLYFRQWATGRYFALRRTPAATVDTGAFQPKRVVFVLAGLIGDSIMSFPAITEARILWPDAHIALLGKTHQRELFASCREIDEFYVCDADPFSIRKSDEIKNLQKWLDDRLFDVAITLLKNQFAPLFVKAGIPIRVGVAGSPLEPCFTHKYEIGSPRTWGTEERLNSLRCLGYEVGSSAPSICTEPGAHESVRDKLTGLGLQQGTKYAVLHPFGSTTRQWWEIENVPALAEGLDKEFGLKTVLVGKRYDLNGVVVDPEIGSAVRESVIDTLGKLKLAELAALIDDAVLVISTDSGPFHIAGALGKQTVGLFRSRRPEHAEAYRTATIILGMNDWCLQTCEWDKCASDPCRQMHSITVEHILATTAQLIGKAERPNKL